MGPTGQSEALHSPEAWASNDRGVGPFNFSENNPTQSRISYLDLTGMKPICQCVEDRQIAGLEHWGRGAG
jgi:hypothetical protein